MRLSDWEARLNAHVREWRSMAGSYGPVPCARFAATGADAMTGADNYADFRGRYKTPEGAARALRKIGAGTLEDTFSRYYADRPLSHVQRGDIVFNGESVGLVVGAHALFAGEVNGVEQLIRVARAEWLRAWAVD